jgi:gas vesicle protein
MGQDPSDIREEIEDTRARMGDTVEALGYKSDVKSRAKESVSGKVGSVKSKLTGATPDGGDMKQGAQQAVGVAQENPLGLAIGGVAVGFLAGMLIPSSRVEDEKLGPMADQVKDRAKDTGQEALERGKQVAQEAAQSAKETAQESGRQQAEELRSSTEDQAREVRERA